MILYHGSYKKIEKPSLEFSRVRTDFGRGFYLTPLKDQAESWAKRFIKETETATLTIYDFDLDMENNSESILQFTEYSKEWVDFIARCRQGEEVDPRISLIIGGVANDKVFNTIQLYFDGLIDVNTAISRLQYEKPNVQYCIKQQAIMDQHLFYKDSEVLK